MKNIILAITLSLAVTGVATTTNLLADQAQSKSPLAVINAMVDQRATDLDQQFGILLTHQERQHLQLALIANKMVTDEAIIAGKTSQQLATDAMQIYQIHDETAQRQVLIKIDALFTTKGSGVQPPCCK